MNSIRLEQILSFALTLTASMAMVGGAQASSPDSYAYGTIGWMTSWNYGSFLPDVTIGNGSLSITAAVCQGGAMPSVKVGNYELIASGGHGSGFQSVLHPYADGAYPTELDNPTEAGSMDDDYQKIIWYGLSVAPKTLQNGKWLPDPRSALAFPYHTGQSSSGIIAIRKVDPATLATSVNMANYIAPCANSMLFSGTSPYNKMTTDFIYRKAVQVGTGANGYPGNVIVLDAQVTVPRAIANLDWQQIMYLQSFFDRETYYNLNTAQSWVKPTGAAQLLHWTHGENVSQLPVIRIFGISGWGDYGLALVPGDLQAGATTTTTYTQTNADYAANPSYTYKFRNDGSQRVYRGVAAGKVLARRDYLVFGSCAQIAATARSLLAAHHTSLIH